MLPAQIVASYAEKIRHYAPFVDDRRSSTAPARELQPIIFNTHGVPSTKTATHAHDFGKGLRPGFARETLVACGIRMLETQHESLEHWYTAHRSSLRTVVPRQPPQAAAAPAPAAAAPPTPRRTAAPAADTPSSTQRVVASKKRNVCECNTALSRNGECTNVLCTVQSSPRKLQGSERRRNQLLGNQ